MWLRIFEGPSTGRLVGNSFECLSDPVVGMLSQLGHLWDCEVCLLGIRIMKQKRREVSGWAENIMYNRLQHLDWELLISLVDFFSLILSEYTKRIIKKHSTPYSTIF